MKGKIQSMEVSYLVHATEDQVKIGAAIKEALRLDSEPLVEDLEGHYGNPIQRVSYHVMNEEATRCFSELIKGLGAPQTADILASINEFLDQHRALYIRLDKQELMRGRFAQKAVDAVRIRVKPRSYLIGNDVAKFYADLVGVQ
jgi:RNA binding exosome subunit